MTTTSFRGPRAGAVRPLAAALLVLCSAFSAHALPVAIKYKTLAPTVVAELPAQQTFLLVTSAQANAALGVAPLAGVDPCTTGGGSLVFKYAPDAAKNAAKKVEAIAEANGDLKYIVPPEFQNADTNKLVIFYKLTASCSNPSLAEPRVYNGRIKLTLSKDPCWACLTGCVKSGTTATCTSYASYCGPAGSWPASKLGGSTWSLSVHFTGSTKCSNLNGGKPGAAGDYAKKTLMDDLYQAGGTQVTSRYGVGSPKTEQLIGTNCKDASETGTGYGVVQFFFESLPQLNARGFQTQIAKNWHKRDACTTKTVPGQDPLAKEITGRLCREIVATGADPAIFGGICVKNAPTNRKYKVGNPLEKACFPGDATLMRVDPSTGARLGAARMDELRIGDVVECLKPAARRGPGLMRDDEQEYVRGSCHVFGYHDANAAVSMEFVALHYTDANGAPAKLRATKEHLVYVAPSSNAVPASAPLDKLPAGGFARRADGVHPGDLLVVRSDVAVEGGGQPMYFTARVEGVTTETHQGSFAPLLTDAGLPIVDGVAAFSWAHLPEHDPPANQNLGEYYRHVRLWSDYFNSRASGCVGEACPCLDAPDDAARRCVRYGDRLADAHPGLSDFAQRTVDLWVKADSEGRTHWDYDTGIALGRMWESSRLLNFLETKVLRAKPHTIAMLFTDMFMVKPKRAA